jgi:hypothetical protein
MSIAAISAIVIGFVGGRVGHDNSIHSGVQIADHLRADRPDVFVQVFENRRREAARDELRRLAQANPGAPIILYGHSWGASALVLLARELERDGIPVALTIQVDSIARLGQEDSLIPANVAQAANFFQPHSIVHGEQHIRAADPARTRILGNFRVDYKNHPAQCEQFSKFPIYARVLWKPHIEIECDPDVTRRVEELVRSTLPPR